MTEEEIVRKDNTRYIAAALLVLVIIADLYTSYRFIILSLDEPENLFDELLRPTVTFLGILVLLFSRNADYSKVLVVCTIVYGLSFLHEAYMDLIHYRSFYDFSVENFVQGSIHLCLSILLLGSSLMFATGRSRSTTAMFVGVVGVILTTMIENNFYLRWGSPPEVILQYMVILPMPTYLLMGYLLMLMKTRNVMSRTALFRIQDKAMDIRKTIPVGLSIDRDSLKELKAVDIDDMGCDVREFPLISYYNERYRAVLTRTPDGVSVSVTSADSDTGVYFTRFMLKGVWCDDDDIEACDLVRIYDRDGFFIQLIARDPPETELKVSKTIA